MRGVQRRPRHKTASTQMRNLRDCKIRDVCYILLPPILWYPIYVWTNENNDESHALLGTLKKENTAWLFSSILYSLVWEWMRMLVLFVLCKIFGALRWDDDYFYDTSHVTKVVECFCTIWCHFFSLHFNPGNIANPWKHISSNSDKSRRIAFDLIWFDLMNIKKK